MDSGELQQFRVCWNRQSPGIPELDIWRVQDRDRKSTRLNSSHLGISYAVFCLKKKNGSGRRGDLDDGGALRLAGADPLRPRGGVFFFKGWGAPGDLPPSPPGRFSD